MANNMYDISGLSYDPAVNPEWFTRAIFGGRLISGGYIGALTGIKGSERLGMLDLNSKVLQPDNKDCAWTPQQAMKLSEKVATVKDYKINLEQCIDDLENKRTAYLLKPGAQNEEIPAELEGATMHILSVDLSSEIEEMLVAGDSSVDPNAFDGMLTQLKNSPDSIKIAGATLTKANVLDEIEKVYDAIPQEVLENEDMGTLYILCSYSVRRLVRQALADKSNTVISSAFSVEGLDTANPRLFYLGLEIVPAKGLDNKTIIAYDSRNTFLTTDLMSDLENVELGNFAKPYDNKVFIRGRLRLGFVIPFEDECVLYTS